MLAILKGMLGDSRVALASLRLPLGSNDSVSLSRGAAMVGALLIGGAIEVALAPWAAAIRAAIAMALVVLAASLEGVPLRGGRPVHRWLVVDDRGVRRLDLGREAWVVDWSQPFGATVLASADRARLLIAFTTPHAVRHVAAFVNDAQDAAAAPTLIARATTAADSDLQMGDDAVLTASDAERLLTEIVRRVPLALDRAYLSDASGEPVVLEPAELRVGRQRIDLYAPLEWRAMIFHECGVCATSVFQATWVRQAGAEVVLVAPVPADGTWLRDAHVAVRAAGEGRTVQKAIARDIRLMQAVVGESPPRDLRRAIDRLFMLPLRRALDGAPRLVRAPSPPPRTLGPRA
jgi:hypothetical protein